MGSVAGLWTDLVGGGALRKFPLLFKFIDAADDLSVQVHPMMPMLRLTKVMSWARPSCGMWFTANQAAYHLGHKPGVTKADFARALEAGGAVLDCLNR